MDLDTMRVVYTVACTGSFTAAAELIPCSQSSVSRRTKMAEDELGVQIFARHSNHEAVTLTADGIKIFSVFTKILNDYDELQSGFSKDSSAGVNMTINLGIPGNTMITSVGIDTMQGDFVSRFRNSNFEITRKREEEIIVLLDLNKIDYALFMRYAWNNTKPFIQYECNDKLRIENIGSYGLYVSTAEGSAISDKKSLKMDELKDIEFLYPGDMHKIPAQRIPSNHIIFFEACRMHNFTPKIASMGSSDRALRDISVKDQRGSTHCAIPGKLGSYVGVKYIPIEDAPIHAEFFLASSKNRNNREFEMVLNWLKEYFE